MSEGGWEGVTSSLVLDEVLWSIRRNATKELALETAERIYAIAHLSVIGVSERVPQRALPLMRKYNLDPRDAFHVATMLEAGITIIVSTDADFDRVKEIRRIAPAAAGKPR
jgi:predicted nucleic acid-binding protein